MPDLAARLGTPRRAAAAARRAARERVGLLAVGFTRPPPSASAPADAREVADAFLTALELFRLRQSDELQRDLRELLDEFTGEPRRRR